MIRALDKLKVIRKGGATNPFFVDEDGCHSIIDALFHLMLDTKTLNLVSIEVAFVVALWKHI